MGCKIGRKSSVAWVDLGSTKEEEGIQLLLHGDGDGAIKLQVVEYIVVCLMTQFLFHLGIICLLAKKNNVLSLSFASVRRMVL